jgi:hypothetical protein
VVLNGGENMSWLIIGIYLGIGLRISVEYKSKHANLIDRVADHFFLVVLWLPVKIVVMILNYMGKLLS